MYTMSLEPITSSADAMTVLPEACAKTAERSASMSKHPPRVIGTPLIFSIFEWNVAIWPVPTKPTIGKSVEDVTK